MERVHLILKVYPDSSGHVTFLVGNFSLSPLEYRYNYLIHPRKYCWLFPLKLTASTKVRLSEDNAKEKANFL